MDVRKPLVEKPNNGVFVIITTSLVVELRDAVAKEYFEDTPIDIFITKRIEMIMSELVMEFIESKINAKATIVSNVMDSILLDLLLYLQTHVMILKIKDIHFLYHDTVFIHC